MTLFLALAIPINKCVFSHPSGVAGRGNPSLKIAGISHSIARVPHVNT